MRARSLHPPPHQPFGTPPVGLDGDQVGGDQAVERIGELVTAEVPGLGLGGLGEHRRGEIVGGLVGGEVLALGVGEVEQLQEQGIDRAAVGGLLRSARGPERQIETVRPLQLDPLRRRAVVRLRGQRPGARILEVELQRDGGARGRLQWSNGLLSAPDPERSGQAARQRGRCPVPATARPRRDTGENLSANKTANKSPTMFAKTTGLAPRL